MARRGGRGTAPKDKSKPKGKKRNLRRPAADGCFSAIVDLGTSSLPGGATHSLTSQARQICGTSAALPIYAAALVFLVDFCYALVIKKAGVAARCVVWRVLFFIPAGFAIFWGILVLLLHKFNYLPIAVPNTEEGPGTVSTPSLPVSKSATTKATAAPVGASGRRAPAAVMHTFPSAGPDAAPLATLHKELEGESSPIDLSQTIKEAEQQMDLREARFEAKSDKIQKAMDKLEQEMDFFNEVTDRILLGEAAYTLASLVEQYVFEGNSSGYQHGVTLKQLKLLYETEWLDAAQARSWEQVVDFVGCWVSMENLVVVEKQVRTARREAAHGYEFEKETATLHEMQRWACMYFSQEEYPQVHTPLLKMLEVLAGFSSIGRPCLPDRSFESKLHPSLLRKF